MLSRISLLSICFCIVTLFARTSCNKKCPCRSGAIDIGFIGFNASETDTIIMRRFSKGSGFSVLGDTVMITPANSGYYPSHDTLGISIRYASPGIISDLDYEFFLPGANRLYRLTDFTEIANEEKCGTKSSRMCRNTVPTVKVNNQASNTVPLGTYSSTLYIRR